MRNIKDPDTRRAEIMNAAAKLFAAKGYLNTTTQDIIEEVNISRGLLYYHFKNKEDILYSIIHKYSKPLIYQLKKVAYDKHSNAVEKVRQFMELTLIPDKDITQENIKLQEAVNLEENRYMLDRFSHELCDKIIEYFSDIIKQGNAEGHFHVMYPEETAAFLMTGYLFVSNDAKISCNNREQLEHYVTAYKSMLEHSLAPELPIFNE